MKQGLHVLAFFRTQKVAPVFSAYLGSPVSFSSTIGLRIYHCQVTSRSDPILKMEASGSCETLIVVEMYNIVSQKTVVFILTAMST